MIHHIKKFLPLLIIIFMSCKKKEIEKHGEILVKGDIGNSNIINKKLPYTIWSYSSKNSNKKYEHLKIYLSNDSIKILNEGKMICSGEIVNKKSTFPDYFKSKITGNDIKKQLKKEFDINATEKIQVVMNSYGDISEKGCQFPFNEVFIVDGYLFFYEKGYYCFETDDKTSSTSEKKLSFLPSKPLTINDFLNESSEFPLVTKKISNDDSQADSIYKIAENVYVCWFDGDKERWYLVTIKNDKLFNKLLIGKSETVETENGNIDNYIDFNIDKDFLITLNYSSGKNVHSSTIQKIEKYQIDKTNYKINRL